MAIVPKGHRRAVLIGAGASRVPQYCFLIMGKSRNRVGSKVSHKKMV